uniref:Retrovirus polyprotein putative n=1 Tax=Albugo laibachii Nc14 TaxID=890382 RepID=F0W626_9STRA|nr:retrovirus polyprotein putative [Albugo laibachii Nc14]|eukprot:CCA16568.1 retrovirus polyprotein putative [Albugo laibachii Nc14]
MPSLFLYIAKEKITARLERSPNMVINVSESPEKCITQMKDGVFGEVYKIKICSVITKITPSFIQPVLEEFSDVFPDKLSDKLPPETSVDFEMHMKDDVQPKSKDIYRLTKTEQDALVDFIQEKLRKGCSEVSNSPWVFNVFGVPKKDPATNTIPKRSEWLRSGDTKITIRWVIDYRHVISQTRAPQIPLPLIEELFDKMQESKVFTVIDLAQGYYQMLVTNNSRQYTSFRTHKETYHW